MLQWVRWLLRRYLVSCHNFFYVPLTTGTIEPLCTGSSVWSNDENFAIAAWSDDSTTPEIDGMPQGSPFTFGICFEN